MMINEEAEMNKHMEIVQDDEVEIDAIPLATKPPVIVEWKTIKEGKMGYFLLKKSDVKSKRNFEDSKDEQSSLWEDVGIKRLL
ncbi:hypothetical protein Tco_1319136 [Tanacetum coccineum]